MLERPVTSDESLEIRIFGLDWEQYELEASLESNRANIRGYFLVLPQCRSTAIGSLFSALQSLTLSSIHHIHEFLTADVAFGAGMRPIQYASIRE